MSNEGPRSLFPLEQRTWAVILAVGAGFGLVAAVALLCAGYRGQGTFTLAIPTVFGYTAAHLAVPSRFLGLPPALVGNGFMFLAALWMAGHQTSRAVDIAVHDSPFALVLVIVMSALLHLAVVVASGESLMRLTRGARQMDAGTKEWQCT